jgi:hypothetical protein
MLELTREQFIQRLVEAGWSEKDAAEEADRVISGNDGAEDDCDIW